MARNIETQVDEMQKLLAADTGRTVSREEAVEAWTRLSRLANVLVEIQSGMMTRAWTALHATFPEAWPCCGGTHAKRNMVSWVPVQGQSRTRNEPPDLHDATWECAAAEADFTLRIQATADGWIATVPVVANDGCSPLAVLVRAGAVRDATGALEGLAGQPWSVLWPEWNGWRVALTRHAESFKERALRAQDSRNAASSPDR